VRGREGAGGRRAGGARERAVNSSRRKGGPGGYHARRKVRVGG